MENETSTRVQFLTGPESSGPIRQCKISGPQRAREDAKREIARIIADNGKELGKSNLNPIGVKSIGAHAPALRAGEDATQILVPNRTVGLIIGRGGETIRDLQERSGCHVNIVGEEKSVNGFRPVNLIGTPQAAAVARQLIDEIVESDTKNMNAQSAGNRDVGRGQPMFGGGDEKINDNITVPSEAVGMIIGKGMYFKVLPSSSLVASDVQQAAKRSKTCNKPPGAKSTSPNPTAATLNVILVSSDREVPSKPPNAPSWIKFTQWYVPPCILLPHHPPKRTIRSKLTILRRRTKTAPKTPTTSATNATTAATIATTITTTITMTATPQYPNNHPNLHTANSSPNNSRCPNHSRAMPPVPRIHTQPMEAIRLT